MEPPLIAHRLGRAYGPDSSWSALRSTLAGPTPLVGLETDVCLTRDGELVLLHDPYLPIRTSLDGWAHERTALEIARGRLLDRSGEPTAERPLLLGGLLDAAPREMLVQLEVKAYADPVAACRTVDALGERLAVRADRHRFELLSFFSAACERAAAHGLAARLIVWADYAPKALAAWARRHGVRGVALEHFLLSAPMVHALRERGLSVTTGTINDAALLERVAPFGLDAVCTDRPHELRRELRQRRNPPVALAA